MSTGLTMLIHPHAILMSNTIHRYTISEFGNFLFGLSDDFRITKTRPTYVWDYPKTPLIPHFWRYLKKFERQSFSSSGSNCIYNYEIYEYPKPGYDHTSGRYESLICCDETTTDIMAGFFADLRFIDRNGTTWSGKRLKEIFHKSLKKYHLTKLEFN